MYEAFYGLKVKPFQLNPDPAFYFDSKQHRRAKAYLEYGLHQNEGFIVVTGEIGAGKTTIVRGLLDALDKDKVVAAQIVSTQLDADDILRMVAAAFGVRFKDLAKADLILALEAFFVEITRRGKRCLLIVDEAQNLTPRAVEELRMLSNFQFESHALLQSFLVGQPEFRAIMLSPQMEQLRQRVIAACHVGPLSAAETRDYIYHRLRCAGSKGEPKFDDAAHQAIYEASGGIPRRINALCDRLLLLGFLNDKKLFGKEDVQEVVNEMGGQIGAGAKPTTAALLAPQALEGDFATAESAALQIDAETAQEAGKTLTSISNRRIADRLLRLERSLVRLEQTNTMMLRVLQQLVDAARVGKAARNAADKKTDTEATKSEDA
ncbi:MAG: XrtA/PEP-CTERM system-associated ATPase [Pseudomonadota bacterium]|uniref:XrtA/PEP-CTERM system-associated ATPase n=1 Tax=Sulfuricystis thermophila TaxID=2496847 RepID=UPI001035866B|nr:XrtA/PEP-CTERM system-associated ATPase [Sulfuricystis thermophila]MDI6750910.1 XrtA-associated ATPase [Rhodocyclaceae bacterium]